MTRSTVCVDLDGVLSSYKEGWKGLEHFGEPIEGAVEFTKELARFANVMIYTTRCCEDLAGRQGYKAPMLKKLVQDWLDKHGFVYTDIYIGQGKPCASAYLDDRAISCVPEEDSRAFQSALTKAKRFCSISQDKDKVDDD